ncbi:heme exporter protein CcmD [Gluconacetobacter aggeris]|uniref:Heme exporter protein D n=1 Tax=Gluconacetobacter aggeris TaxID=1286186 RepID=A0A7W4NV23_9PROT|nr:heme exporter protein CcmD [Gluconacetobacter aggeris]MBB2167366.1 heme exporter protein CcmD [Gluconacetobacter aggeris]
MTHLPYIVTAYGLTIGLAVILGGGAALRLRRARARLAALERPSRTGGASAP